MPFPAIGVKILGTGKGVGRFCIISIDMGSKECRESIDITIVMIGQAIKLNIYTSIANDISESISNCSYW